MFPQASADCAKLLRFPRVCGDVSKARRRMDSRSSFSPRMRGCFPGLTVLDDDSKVFPAYAGMFLGRSPLDIPFSGFPRVCGDVSTDIVNRPLSFRFSPRMRGCFSIRRAPATRTDVFPAYAGMFLPLKAWR